MKKLTALLLAVLMLLSMAACGSNGGAEPTTETAPAETATDAAATAEGTRLRIGLDFEPSTMNPTTQADGQGSMFVTMSLYDGLWKTLVSGDMVMLVAESYEFVEEEVATAEASDEPSGEASGEASGEPCGTSLVVHLREGLTFSDGNPITAEDVLWSFNYAASGTAGAMRLSNIALPYAYTKDDLTVVFPLYKQTPTIVEDLALIYIMEKAWCEQSEDNINLNPVSSGAYTLESWESGMGVTLAKRDDYFDAANVYYDTVDITFIAAEETRLLAFENGDFDLVTLTASTSIDEINSGVMDNASIVVCPVQSLTGFQMNMVDFDIFDDVRVRQAIGHAIDVPTLVAAICGSAYTVADSILPSSNWAHVACGNYDYDVDLAKQLLAEAGYSEANPFTFTCTISDGGYNSMLAEATQAMLAEAGIVMNIETKDGATYMNMILNNEIQFAINSYMGSFDPAGVVNSRRPGLPAHLSNYADAELEALLEECCNSMEGEDVRKPMWEELQTRAYEYANFIPLYESNVNYAVTDAIAGDSLAASMLADGYLYANYIKGVG